MQGQPVLWVALIGGGRGYGLKQGVQGAKRLPVEGSSRTNGFLGPLLLPLRAEPPMPPLAPPSGAR